MGQVRVESFAVSLDGYGAGPDQDINNGLGVGGGDLHQWFIPTRTFQRTHGAGDGTTGGDDDFAARGFRNIGAWIMGRNMFGPIRGPWPDSNWKGWWGDNPPYHVPVLCPDSSRAPAPRDGRQYDVPFRNGRHSRSAGPGARGCARHGRAHWWRAQRDSAVSSKGSH